MLFINGLTDILVIDLLCLVCTDIYFTEIILPSLKLKERLYHTSIIIITTILLGHTDRRTAGIVEMFF